MKPRKNVLASRRRVEDDGEEEGGLETTELEDDSLSETSALSEEEDEDVDGSDTSDIVGGDIDVVESTATNGHVTVVNGTGLKTQPAVQDPLAAVGGDTEAMMNGLNIGGEQMAGGEIEFDDMTEEMDVLSLSTRKDQLESSKDETPFEKRRREHEEYKKRRDQDPAFVPNRGAFFMHDHRHAGPAANGFRPFGRGRGRGRGAVGGPFSPANQLVQASEATQGPWAHDMHETVVQPDPPPPQSPLAPDNHSSLNIIPRNPPFTPKSTAPNRSLSKTTLIGNIQIRLFIAGMADPIIFSGVPVKQYTRLPQHRPPLRRDKPVRISLPDQPVRYIYPAPDRSFIFIPRAQRPNQQGFGRGRGRPGFGVYSGYGSRRTSVYGGSNYSPSIAMSRRSSLAHELHRENVISPAGSTTSRNYGVPMESSKPVVKLPPSAPGRVQQPLQETGSNSHGMAGVPVGPSVKPPYNPAYPPPQKPTFRENRPVPIPMHQPRPQKAVSVADIESPATHSFPTPQQQKQQPFHQQVPIQSNGHPYPHDPSTYNLHSRNPSYPSHASSGTPLSHIPESAIHARPFQPVPFQHQQFYPQHTMMPQAAYYYPIPDPRPPPYSAAIASAAVAAPVFVPSPQQNPYLAPVPTVSGPSSAQQTGQGSTVAQESNGMVYYYDSSQFYAGAAGGYPPTGYALSPQPGGVVGYAGMMTPSPDVYYYPQPGQGGTYYSQQ